MYEERLAEHLNPPPVEEATETFVDEKTGERGVYESPESIGIVWG